MKITPRFWIWTAVLGAVLLVLGVVLGWVVFPMAVDQKIGEELSLKPETDAWERFVRLPVPLDFKIYAFNVTNPEEVVNGAKPRLQEMGPYVYKQHREKYDVKINSKDDTVSYYQHMRHEFDSKASGTLRESDVITVINPVLLGVLGIMENIPALAKGTALVDQASKVLFPGSNPLFLTTTAGQLFFSGVRIPCGRLGRSPPPQSRLPQLPNNLTALIVCSSMKRIKVNTIKTLPDGDLLFSMFGYKNDSYDGRYEVRTGITAPKDIGQIASWEGQKFVTAWGAPTCNAINGTQGDIFSPYVTRDSVLEVFSTDICRTMPVRYELDTTYRGLHAYRFTPGPEVMADAAENGNNYCFCPQSAKGLTKENACLKKGALDLSGCQGVPVIVTYPHFYAADESYLSAVEGIKPIKELHSMTLDIEPFTGTPLRGGKKMQLNIQMKPTDGVPITRNVTNSLVPVLWVYEGVELGDDFIELLNGLLFNTLLILDIVKYLLVSLGVVLIILGVTMYIVASKKRSSVSPTTAGPQFSRAATGGADDIGLGLRTSASADPSATSSARTETALIEGEPAPKNVRSTSRKNLNLVTRPPDKT